MAYPARLLGEGEHIEYETRPHWRVLLVPLVALFVIVGATAYLLGAVESNSSWQDVLRWGIFLVAASAFSYWVIRPIIFWATTHYVFTDRRVITRTGLIARRGRDMPLSRVNNVNFSFTVLERIFNCGTLTVESASETGALVIANVPDVENLQGKVNRWHEADDVRRRRDADPSTGPLPGGPSHNPLPGDGSRP